MTAANADQLSYWNGEAGERWRAAARDSDAAFAPLSRAAIDAAHPVPGERVIDVGCGCGATTMQLAELVAPGGRVSGVDLSAPMLDLARERVRARRIGNVKLIVADATTVDLPPGSFDLVFSQFGVMFFADPVATFTHLRNALAPAGRLTFRCWRSVPENPFFNVPLTAARSHVPPPPNPPAPDAPGPNAFADPARVRDILARAGFSAIAIEPRDTQLHIGDDLDTAVSFLARIGAAARVLEDATPKQRSAAIAATRTALEPHATSDGVFLTAGTWLVRADGAPD